MKRILSGLLIFALMLGLGACSQGTQVPETTGVTAAVTEAVQEPVQTTEPTQTQEVLTEPIVPEPMPYQVYEFDHTPTTDELRAMAVKAMRDELTVQFGVDKFYRYTKRERVGEKFYTYVPQNVYCGLPYNDASMSLIQFFEYYDPETGLMVMEGDPQLMDRLIGNSCAGSVCAAMATVSPSIRGFSTTEMTPYYGFVPVGPYYHPPQATSYKIFHTGQICELNGAEVMYASYACMLPGDGMSSTPDEHAIMCIEPAHVVYKANGDIDPVKSYIAIQDQRGGVGKGYYTQTVDGVDYHYSGRTYHEYTFEELFTLGYIPITAPEFVGEREYVEPSVSFDIPDCTLENVALGNISSQYPIYVLRMILVDEEGNETLIDKNILDKWNAAKAGEQVTAAISSILTRPNSDTVKNMLEEGKTYTLRYDAVLSNGSVHTAVELEITG